jgi:hypothetical protein
LGFNPGGAGGNPLGQNIDSTLLNKTNAYLDGGWEIIIMVCGLMEKLLSKKESSGFLRVLA